MSQLCHKEFQLLSKCTELEHLPPGLAKTVLSPRAVLKVLLNVFLIFAFMLQTSYITTTNKVRITIDMHISTTCRPTQILRCSDIVVLIFRGENTSCNKI